MFKEDKIFPGFRHDGFYNHLKDTLCRDSVTFDDMLALIQTRARCPETVWTMRNNFEEVMFKLNHGANIRKLVHLYEFDATIHAVLDSMVVVEEDKTTFGETMNWWIANGCRPVFTPRP
jgi:hypothetical protein